MRSAHALCACAEREKSKRAKSKEQKATRKEIPHETEP